MVPTRATSARCILLAALLAAAAAAVAAPTSSDELREQEPTGPAGVATPRAASPGTRAAPSSLPTTTQSRTVELLLQLQDQPQSVSQDPSRAGDPGRRAPSSSRRSEGDPPPADSTNPFSNLGTAMREGTAPAKDSGGEAEARQRTAAPLATAGRADMGAAGGGGTSPNRESLLSNPMVRFLRDNKTWIISVGIVVLVGVWLAASATTGRSRR